jgi:hypothetical protein
MTYLLSLNQDASPESRAQARADIEWLTSWLRGQLSTVGDMEHLERSRRLLAGFHQKPLPETPYELRSRLAAAKHQPPPLSKPAKVQVPA